MALDGVMPLLIVAVVMVMLVPLGATKLVKMDLIRGNGGSHAKGTSHIDILVSRNDEEPHSLNGDHFAAYMMGDKVTLTCITEGYPEELVNLSWWEDKRSLHYIRQYSQFARSSTASLDGLSLEDSGRTFTCRADDSTQTKTVTLQLDFSSRDDSDEDTGSRLHIVVNHDVAMKGDGLLLIGPQDHLSLACLMQGPGVKRVSWWEGEMELVQNTESLKEHASSSTLLLRHLTTADSGRRLTCRVDDSTLQHTVELLQTHRDFKISPTEKNDQTSTVHIFGNTTLTSEEVNTRTIIAIWIGISLFIAVGLCLAKLCKKRTTTPTTNTSSSSNKGKQAMGSPGKGYNYSRVDAIVTPQGMKNRTLIFGRRFSESAVPFAFTGDAAQTHGGKKASEEAYTNPGFVSYV